MSEKFDLFGGDGPHRFDVQFTHRGKSRTVAAREIVQVDEDLAERAFPVPPVPFDESGKKNFADQAWQAECRAVDFKRAVALIAIVTCDKLMSAEEVRAAHGKLVARYRDGQLTRIYQQISAYTDMTEADVQAEVEGLLPTTGTAAPDAPAVP